MIVALRALGLGDLLAGVPALRALRSRFPAQRLVLATPAWLAPLARHAVDLDDVVPVDGLHASLPPALHGAALAVNLHGRGPQSTALLAATSPEHLVAFDVPDGPSWRDDEHERDRWCRLLVESGTVRRAHPEDLRIAVPPSSVEADVADATVVHPGASAPSRRWPVDRWAAVAAAEAGRGRRVLVTGSADERPLASAVAWCAGLDDDAVVAGDTDVLDLVAVVAAAGRVVCGDTGVAHVASAVGTPSVVLFGPVPPSRWGPPVDGPHVALWRGSFGDPHGQEHDPGLLSIGVDEVVAALASLDQAAVTSSL